MKTNTLMPLLTFALITSLFLTSCEKTERTKMTLDERMAKGCEYLEAKGGEDWASAKEICQYGTALSTEDKMTYIQLTERFIEADKQMMALEAEGKSKGYIK